MACTENDAALPDRLLTSAFQPALPAGSVVPIVSPCPPMPENSTPPPQATVPEGHSVSEPVSSGDDGAVISAPRTIL
jgi:hypothetical protein